MTNRLWLAAALLVALATVAGAGPARAERAKKHLLVVTYTQGWGQPDSVPHTFRHVEGIAAGLVAMKAIAEKSGAFTLDFADSAEDVQKKMSPEGLKAYDGVVFLNTTGDLGIPDPTFFYAWLKSGKAFIGMHSASDTYHNDPRYADMLGAEFDTHHQQCAPVAIVNDPHHPATRMFNKTWQIKDEIYLQKKFDRYKVHMLLYTNKHPDDGSPDANKPGDYPLAWCKMYGKGRVFYTAYGHRADVWENPLYRKHILGGILWALALERGSAKPIPPLPGTE